MSENESRNEQIIKPFERIMEVYNYSECKKFLNSKLGYNIDGFKSGEKYVNFRSFLYERFGVVGRSVFTLMEEMCDDYPWNFDEPHKIIIFQFLEHFNQQHDENYQKETMIYMDS